MARELRVGQGLVRRCHGEGPPRAGEEERPAVWRDLGTHFEGGKLIGGGRFTPPESRLVAEVADPDC
jgi:hypothetical protein